jgi:hypothetical protein
VTGDLRKLLDELDQLVGPIALAPGELDQLASSRNDRACFWRPGDGDATTTAEVEQPFITEGPHGPQDRVPVDAEHSREIAGRRQPLPRLCLTISDRATNLGGHLVVKLHRAVAVELAVIHDAIYTSFI